MKFTSPSSLKKCPYPFYKSISFKRKIIIPFACLKAMSPICYLKAISSSPCLNAISQICCLKAVSPYLYLKAMSTVGTRPRVTSTIHQAQTPLPVGQAQVSPFNRSWGASPRLIPS